jgi:hypothetical protein
MANGGKPISFKTKPRKTEPKYRKNQIGLIHAKAEGCSGSIQYESKCQTWWPQNMGNHCSPFLFLS